VGQVNLGTASGRIVIDGSGAKAGFATAEAAANAFFNVVADRVHELQDVGDKLTKIGAVAAGGFGLAINAAANFQQSLSGIKAVSGATNDQMDAVAKTALRLGADTKFSAGEAAQAIEELIKAGVSVEDALNGAADATVNLAAAGEIDLPRAAEIAANAMSVFNLSAAELPHVADQIAGAANASAIDVEQFAQSLSQSGAAANLAGQGFDDLATAIALMGNAGIKGSDAGTSLKTMLLNLNPVTDKQKGLMEDLGIITKEAGNRFFDAKGKAKSFADIAGVLQDALKGQTQQQKLANLEILFGSDAIRAAAVVSKAGTKGFNDMAAAMGKVTAAGVAATRMDNLKGSLEQLKGSLETAGIIIGRVFLPAVTKVVDLITRAVNVFNNAPEGVQKFLTVVVALGGGLSLLTGIAIKLLFVLVPLLAKFLGFTALKSIFSIFTRGFAAFRGGAGILGALSVAGGRAITVFGRMGKFALFVFKGIRTLVGALGILRVAIGFAFGPWGALIAGVIAAVTILFKKYKPFHDLVIKSGQVIKGVFLQALAAAKVALGQVADGFRGIQGGGAVTVFNQLGAGARILWNALKELAAVFQAQVMPVLREAGGQILSALGTAFAQISSAAHSAAPAFQQLGTALKPLFANLVAVGRAVAPLVAAWLKFQFAIVKVAVILVGVLLFALIKVATFVAGKLLPPFIKFATWIATGLIGVLGPVVGFFIKIGAAIAQFVAGIIGFFTGAKAAADTGAGQVQASLSALVGFFVGIWNTVKAVVVGAWTAIWTFITTAITTVKTIIMTGLNFIKAVWTAFWSGPLGQLVLNALGLIGDIIKLALAAIKFVFLAWIAGVKASWNIFWTGLTTIVSTVWNGIKAVVAAGIAIVKAAFIAGWNAIKAATAAVLGPIVAFVGARIRAIRAVVSAVWNAIKAATAAAWAVIRARIVTPIAAAASTVYARTAGIRAAISAAWNAVKSTTSRVWNAVVTAIRSAVNRAIAVVRTIKDKVVSAVSGAGTWLINAGKDIIRGLIAGIDSMIDTARAKLQSLTKLIPKSKGPPKKDKVLLYDNGVLIMQGLIKGLESKFAPFQDTLRGLTTDIPVTAMSGVTPNSVPKIVVPQQRAAKFPNKLTLSVGGREFDAYVIEKADGVLGDAAAKIGRGRK